MLSEKHRPVQLSELVGRDSIVAELQAKIKSPDGIPHLMFYGAPGTGKTCVAHCIASEIYGKDKNQNFFEFNASNDRGIDFIRDSIIDIAKRRPLNHPYKIIFLDEADMITAEAQACLRRPFETCSQITRFIFACNYPYKLIEAIRSRFVKYEFGPLDIKTIANRLKKIAIIEKLPERPDMEYVTIAKKSKGDLRDAIGMLDGNTKTVDLEISKMTLADIKGKGSEDRIKLVLAGDPDIIFDLLWDKIKAEKAWHLMDLIAECKYHMNYGNLKEVPLCKFILKV